MIASAIYLEISQSVLRALRDERGIELPLERDAKGRLTAACKERVTGELSRFVDRKSWQPRLKAFCGIGVGGVSLRRMSLPASSKEEFQRVLELQIESEFPLPPDELAWGWRPIASNGTDGKRDVLVMAVKKEVVQEYADLLAGCGLHPAFTLAALARNELCPEPSGSHALLESGSKHFELATFEAGELSAVRALYFDADAIGGALAQDRNGRKTFVFSAPDQFTKWKALGFEPIKFEPGLGRSAATLGLKKLAERNAGELPLALRVKVAARPGRLDLSQPQIKRWAVRAAILLVALLVLPLAEAMIGKAVLTKRIAALKTQRDKVLPVVDRELDFLQSLRQTQPPYLDALYLFAKSAPPNAKIESLTMNRRGEVSLKGSMQNGQAVTDFRTKLIESGFFSNVVVEEQSPTPDRQKVNVRMTMLWKSPAERAVLAIGPTAAEIERAKTNSVGQAGGGGSPGGMMMPPGMPMMPAGMPSPGPGRKR